MFFDLVSLFVEFEYLAEFGLVLHLVETLNFKAGVEALQAQQVSDVKGTHSSGAELYTLESSTFVWNPNLSVEYIYRQTPTLRFFSYFGMGRGSLTLENKYQMTTLGESTYVPTYTEKLEGSALAYFGGFGLEALLSDTTTIQIDAGYRHLKFTQLKHKGNATTIQGSFAKGDVAENDDGSGRTLDFSGFYMGLSFRFYIEIL